MRIDSIKIKLLMAEKDITQAILAKKCGISKQNINMTLSRGTASAAKINKIAYALGVPARELAKED